MEMLDILHKDGSSTGKQASKVEAHQKGLWHRAAHVWFINNKGEILLQRRAKHIESHPDKYDISAAGHLSAGDTPLQGALREVQEELGITLQENELVRIGEISSDTTQHNGTYINREYDDVYVVHKDIPLSEFTIQESEVDHIAYISIETFRRWVAEEKEDLVMHPDEYKMLFEYLDLQLKK